MKKIVGLLLSLAIAGTAFMGCSKKDNGGAASGSSAGSGNSNKRILIGVSIWSSTDTLGSQCKRIVDAAA